MPYGAQTDAICRVGLCMFESCVMPYGAQTKSGGAGRAAGFESCVMPYGAQTRDIVYTDYSGLRVV